jgi:hypothetical protein
MKQAKEPGIRVVSIVVLIGLAVAVAALIWRIASKQNILLFACVAVFYGFLLYYCLKGYRKPHGNMIQILMLILAVYVASTTVAADSRWGVYSRITLLASNLAAVFMGYMAGRLNKIEENKYTAALVTILLCIRCVWFLENLDMAGGQIVLFVLDRCLALLMWAALVIIYFFRFKEHKKAGEEAPAGEEA